MISSLNFRTWWATTRLKMFKTHTKWWISSSSTNNSNSNKICRSRTKPTTSLFSSSSWTSRMWNRGKIISPRHLVSSSSRRSLLKLSMKTSRWTSNSIKTIKQRWFYWISWTRLSKMTRCSRWLLLRKGSNSRFRSLYLSRGRRLWGRGSWNKSSQRNKEGSKGDRPLWMRS